ncbi:MFS transporter [Novosphingobium taihuense]|nr:MFS transporter [Novosphingobium taihuense]TWH87054.1 putative MFS family arabinose efflux permease [Novosphingobium taihuense]
MEVTDSDWSRLGVVGKSALVGIGPFVSIGLFSMGAALPKLASDVAGQPNADALVQLIGTVVAPLFAIGSPLAGWLIGRLGVRNVYIASVLMMTVGGVAPAFCDSLYAILAMRVLLAFGVAGGFTAGMSGIARLPDNQRPAILGLNSFVGGAICLPLFPLVGMLAEESWRNAFLVHAILLVMILPGLSLPGNSKDRALPTGHVASRVNRGILAGVPAKLAVATALMGLAIVSSSMYSPFLLSTLGVTGSAKVGQFLGLMSLCSLLGSGSYGWLHRRIGTFGLLILGISATAAGCLAMGMASALPTAVTGMCFLGMGLAVFSAAAYAAAIDWVGPAGNTPAALGVMTFCLYGSQLAFPLISGSLGAAQGPASVFLLISALAVLSLTLAIGLGKSPVLGTAQ